jgi:hypothetical protein
MTEPTDADYAALRHILEVRQADGRWKKATLQAIADARAEGWRDGYTLGYDRGYDMGVDDTEMEDP